ncbi:MAG: hypothetical protein Q8R65_00545 [Polynucleobacter sp.]|jgi:predicted nuclease with TOPRIM domain|nr:hypothetical protein [Polynucleobacter sp.]MDZ4057257.1 hypothetical protein [Polynucleobacter sp.]
MHDSSDSTTASLDGIHQLLARLQEKLGVAIKTADALRQDRVRLEAKIEDAQSRIQHILSRLPEQNDTRQLNLLGASDPAPTNPDDDHEPTTH